VELWLDVFGEEDITPAWVPDAWVSQWLPFLLLQLLLPLLQLVLVLLVLLVLVLVLALVLLLPVSGRGEGEAAPCANLHKLRRHRPRSKSRHLVMTGSLPALRSSAMPRPSLGLASAWAAPRGADERDFTSASASAGVRCSNLQFCRVQRPRAASRHASLE
jgi:hypothetical protein